MWTECCMWLFEVGLPSLTMPSTANSPSCCCGLVQPQLRNATDRRVFVSCDGWRGQAGPVLRPACEPTQAQINARERGGPWLVDTWALILRKANNPAAVWIAMPSCWCPPYRHSVWWVGCRGSEDGCLVSVHATQIQENKQRNMCFGCLLRALRPPRLTTFGTFRAQADTNSLPRCNFLSHSTNRQCTSQLAASALHCLFRRPNRQAAAIPDLQPWRSVVPRCKVQGARCKVQDAWDPCIMSSWCRHSLCIPRTIRRSR